MPTFSAAVEDLLEIDHRGRIGADDDDGQLGRVAVLGGEGGHVGGHALADVGCDGPALEQHRLPVVAHEPTSATCLVAPGSRAAALVTWRRRPCTRRSG